MPFEGPVAFGGGGGKGEAGIIRKGTGGRKNFSPGSNTANLCKGEEWRCQDVKGGKGEEFRGTLPSRGEGNQIFPREAGTGRGGRRGVP